MNDNIDLSEYIPRSGLSLVKYSRKQFIDKLGLEIVQRVVASILKGKNVRDLTEGLTQRRVLMLSASIITTYIEAMSSIENFENRLSEIIKSNITLRLTSSEKSFLFWFIGLTQKSIQNVVRDSEISNYIDTFDSNLKEIAKDVERIYGPLSIPVHYNGKDIIVKWPNLLRCLLAVGAATLTTRGSEKSLYGKAFETMVLGSVLTILGFKHIDKSDISKDNKVFLGTNIENAAFGLSMCAERNAIFNAYVNGVKKDEIVALAIIADTEDPVSPCGSCRQVLSELFPKNGKIYLANFKGDIKETNIVELLPYSFSKDDLN